MVTPFPYCTVVNRVCVVPPKLKARRHFVNSQVIWRNIAIALIVASPLGT
jgi:hypothetical protein